MKSHAQNFMVLRLAPVEWPRGLRPASRHPETLPALRDLAGAIQGGRGARWRRS